MYVRRVGRSFGALLTALALAAPAQAAEPPGLGVTPFTLSADQGARRVNVAVDDSGTGHFAWDFHAAGTSGPDPLIYCRVPRGASACQGQQTLNLPLQAFAAPQVLAPFPGTVILLAYRCCGPGEGTYAVISSDGGTTFGAPRLVSTVPPGQAVFGPGGNASIVDDVVTAGIHYQSASLAGPPPATSANVGNGPGLQGYDGTIGFGTPNVPVVAFDDLTNGFFREWSGSGDVNDLSTWGATQPLGPLTEVRMATGPKGVVLIGKQRDASFRSSYVARRFDPAAHTFGSPVPVSDLSAETDVIFRDVFEDAGGNVAAVWIANGVHPSGVDPLRYRVSTDGGATWRAERTLTAANDQAFNLNMGAAPDGGGFVAWDGNDQGPVMAIPIPALAAQGLPAPVAGKTVNASVVSGTVRVKLPGTKRFVALTDATQLPVGTVFDTTKGTVSLTAAATGGTQTGRFSRGQFKFGQKRGGLYRGKLTANLTMTGPPLGCGANKADADAARRRNVRFLLAKASGRFRVIGSKSFGVERGTTWLTKDSCAGTLTKVIAGRVWIFDFARRRTIELNPGQSYLATGRRR